MKKTLIYLGGIVTGIAASAIAVVALGFVEVPSPAELLSILRPQPQYEYRGWVGSDEVEWTHFMRSNGGYQLEVRPDWPCDEQITIFRDTDGDLQLDSVSIKESDDGLTLEEHTFTSDSIRHYIRPTAESDWERKEETYREEGIGLSILVSAQEKFDTYLEAILLAKENPPEPTGACYLEFFAETQAERQEWEQEVDQLQTEGLDFFGP